MVSKREPMTTESARRLWRTGRRAAIRIASRSRQVPPPGTERAGPRLPEDAAALEQPPPRLFSFDASRCDEQSFVDPTQLARLQESHSTLWLDFESAEDAEVLERVAQHFGWHPLVVEDVCSAHQRPKVEDYEGYAYLVLRMPTRDQGLPLE